MGTLDAAKAKSNFLKLKNDLVYVRNNYEKSGNREKCLSKIDDSLDFEPVDGLGKKIF